MDDLTQAVQLGSPRSQDGREGGPELPETTIHHLHVLRHALDVEAVDANLEHRPSGPVLLPKNGLGLGRSSLSKS